jgi:hypothetical protein
MAYLLQSLIIFAVLASNIQYHWTPNGYLASLLAGIAAYLATAACLSIGELITRIRIRRTGDSR